MVLKLGGKPVERGCRQTGEWGGSMSKEDLGLSPWRALKRGNFELNQGTGKAKVQLR